MSITVTFTPKKFIAKKGHYSQCNNNDSTNLRRVQIQHYIASINRNDLYTSDSNIQNNTTWLNEYNAKSYGHTAMETIRSSDLSPVFFGEIAHLKCPTVDLAVTKISQSFVGELDVEWKRTEDKFAEYSEMKNPTPITFVAKYENIGSADADNSRIVLDLRVVG